MIDLRQLRYFVAVAELEHIGHAAERLHISQSPLSRQIMQLEADLGLTLFERVKKRLFLTPEGRHLLEDARALLAEADRFAEKARRLGRGETGHLTIGYVEGAVHAGALRRALRLFQVHDSDVHVHLRPLRSAPQLAALRSRELDFGILYSPPPDNDQDLQFRLIVEEPVLLAMPIGHPLADMSEIRPGDLDGRPWITLPRSASQGFRERFLRIAAEAGFSPDIRFETAEPLTVLGLVGAGLGVALVQASIQSLSPPHVTFRRLPWLPITIRIHAVWRKTDDGSLVRKILAGLDMEDPS
ncbi:LysR substrate-binding domain-containing protein [Telmatospirillum sp.]|uniref:LysR substrate-binding domain-containing protein n=1 Tax=Telmatospirillum sp. TaxID=2079197 RepID=UPI0028504F51|nr:LysR substrate-binding domain-containing protein [Telmatospirillum sp.]MDR3437899.1 LysR substrate-binding domain-containing protein [Telmatospirillum sp.]